MELGEGCKEKIPAFIRLMMKLANKSPPLRLGFGYANSSLGTYMKKSSFIFSPTYKTTVFQLAE